MNNGNNFLLNKGISLWNVEVGTGQRGKNADLLQSDCQTLRERRNLLSPYFHGMPVPEEPGKILKLPLIE